MYVFILVCTLCILVYAGNFYSCVRLYFYVCLYLCVCLLVCPFGILVYATNLYSCVLYICMYVCICVYVYVCIIVYVAYICVHNAS